MLIKTPLLHQSFGPRIFSLSVCLSLSFSAWSPGVHRPSEFTFLPGLLRPSRESALCLHPIERAPEASVKRASPMPGTLLAFCVNQGISASFSPLLSYHRLRTTRFWSIKGPQQMSNLICFSSYSLAILSHSLLLDSWIPKWYKTHGLGSQVSSLHIFSSLASQNHSQIYITLSRSFSRLPDFHLPNISTECLIRT